MSGMIDTETLGSRLRIARKRKNMSQKALSDASGISQTSISELENDIIKNPRHLPVLAAILGTTEQELRFGSNSTAPEIQTRTIPVLDSAAAAAVLACTHPLDPATATGAAMVPNDESRAVFAIRAIDDTMASRTGFPSFPAGSVLCLQPTNKARSGDFVIVRITPGNTLLFRQLKTDGIDTFLQPLNPDYPTRQMTENMEICATVVFAYTPISL